MDSEYEYLPRDKATRVRVYRTTPEWWEIDAEDGAGNYTEDVWTHCGFDTGDPRRMTKADAVRLAPAFAEAIGRPGLPVVVLDD